MSDKKNGAEAQGSGVPGTAVLAINHFALNDARVAQLDLSKSELAYREARHA